MSFTAEVKDELSRLEDRDKSAQLAQLSALMRVCGTLSFRGSGRYSIRIATETGAVARTVIKMTHKLFDLDTALTVRRSVLHKTRNYLIEMPEQDELADALLELSILAPGHGLAAGAGHPLAQKRVALALQLGGAGAVAHGGRVDEDVDRGRLHGGAAEVRSARHVGKKHARALLAQLLQGHEGPGAADHGAVGRQRGLVECGLHGVGAGGVLPRQGVGGEDEAIGPRVLVYQDKKLVADALGLRQGKADVPLDRSVAGLAHGVVGDHGRKRGAQGAHERRRGAASGNGLARGEALGEVGGGKRRQAGGTGFRKHVTPKRFETGMRRKCPFFSTRTSR